MLNSLPRIQGSVSSARLSTQVLNKASMAATQGSVREQIQTLPAPEQQQRYPLTAPPNRHNIPPVSPQLYRWQNREALRSPPALAERPGVGSPSPAQAWPPAPSPQAAAFFDAVAAAARLCGFSGAYLLPDGSLVPVMPQPAQAAIASTALAGSMAHAAIPTTSFHQYFDSSMGAVDPRHAYFGPGSPPGSFPVDSAAQPVDLDVVDADGKQHMRRPEIKHSHTADTHAPAEQHHGCMTADSSLAG